MRLVMNIQRLLPTLVFTLVLGNPAVCLASELLDSLIVGEQNGIFFPDKCCWVDLPRTERFLATVEECPSLDIGGIVGNFRLADNKIWLVGLDSCRGDIPLEKIYPELGNPAPATWLNGIFFAKINSNSKTCNPMTETPIPMYLTTLRLKIENGAVIDMQRQENEVPSCQDIENRKVPFPYDQWRGANP